MKRYYRLLTLIFAFATLPCKADEWIRINQLGYLPQSIKGAVFMSETKTDVQEYLSLIHIYIPQKTVTNEGGEVVGDSCLAFKTSCFHNVYNKPTLLPGVVFI